MANQGSVTQWIGGLRNGDPQAAEIVWQHFFDRLIRIARGRLRKASRRVSDEDDVVTDAFDSFFRGVQSGRFPRLDDRQDLWEVLLLLTCRKSTNQMLAANRVKRGGGAVRGESVFGDEAGIGSYGPAATEPTPEFAAEFAEQFRLRLASLRDPVLQKVALLKLEGYSTSEIAQAIGRRERTVQRKLRNIRELWMLDNRSHGGEESDLLSDEHR